MEVKWVFHRAGRLLVLRRRRGGRLVLTSDCGGVNRWGAFRSLLLAPAELLQPRLEGPPVLAAEVLLKLPREGQLCFLANVVSVTSMGRRRRRRRERRRRKKSRRGRRWRRECSFVACHSVNRPLATHPFREAEHRETAFDVR